MITSKELSLLLGTIALISKGSCREIKYEGPSQITINENFKEPIMLPPGFPGLPTRINNVIHQGTNFFFSPHFLLGGQIPPPIGAVIASINHGDEKVPEIEENIKPVPVEENKPIVLEVSERFPKPVEENVVLPELPNDNAMVPILPPLKVPLVEETDIIQEVIEPHDIITINEEIQPVLTPKIIVTPQLLTIHEAPVLPPLIMPEFPLIVAIEESISPLPVHLPPISETEPYFPFEPSVYSVDPSFIREIDVNVNKIPTAPVFLPPILREFPKTITGDMNKTVIFIPIPPELPPFVTSEIGNIENPKEFEINFPLPAIDAHNIVSERVLPNMFNISKKATPKTIEIIPIPTPLNVPVPTVFR